LCICILSLGGLLSCGIDAYYFIDYIPQGEYNITKAVINLPSPTRDNGYDKDVGYFDNFIIFYRIYISTNIVQTGVDLIGQGTNLGRSNISPTLNSDYNGLWSLTDLTSTGFIPTSNLEITFNGRRYCLLTLENADIDSVLGSGSLGGRLEIAFPPNSGTRPTLTINGNSYVMQRAANIQYLNPPITFRPKPEDRNFLNHSDLYNTANATNEINADVATNTGDVQYTYISMYIAAKGKSPDTPPRYVYSQPTFIGIFRLANSS